MTRLEHLDDVWRRAHAGEPKAKEVLPALMHAAWPMVTQAANRACAIAECLDDAFAVTDHAVEAVEDTAALREEVRPHMVEHAALVERALAREHPATKGDDDEQG